MEVRKEYGDVSRETGRRKMARRKEDERREGKGRG